MININIEPENFEYDIQSLVTAFFPGEDILVCGRGKATGEERFCLDVHFCRDISEDTASDGECRDTIYISVSEQNETVFKDSSPADFSDRKDTKNRLKRLEYRLLSLYTGRKLPWGTLTGIRPVKIPLALIEEGRDENTVRAYMKETYLVSDKKLDLSMEIAGRELDILERTDYKKRYSVYIGIPFCPTTCLYCSFTSYSISKYKDKTDSYIKALFREIEFTGTKYADKKVSSIYIGGGTPTTLDEVQLDRLLAKIEETFLFDDETEFTLEAGRPDSITYAKLKVIKRHRVTRISINPQTMNQRTLDLIGRKHTVGQIKEVFGLARDIGFDNINMDFIVGLPGECYDDIKFSMDGAAALAPDSLTIHSLAIKRAARLNMFREDYADLTIENSGEIMDMTYQCASHMGLLPYYLYRQKNMAGNMENVGYARRGKESLYNILIMEQRQTIMALGAGSVTRLVSPESGEAGRISNVKNVDIYIEQIDDIIERKNKLIENKMIESEGLA